MSTTDTPALRLQRTFDCTPEEMWAAWTDPVQVAKWWNPAPGVDSEVHEVDARPGGRFRVTMRIPGAEARFGTDRFPVPGTFLHVDPPHALHLRLRAEEKAPDEITLKVRLAPSGAGTRLTLEIFGDPGEGYRDGMEPGWRLCLDKLDAHVARTTTEVTR